MGVRVLFVEDEADARELVAMMLAQDGAEVRTAVSAPEALAACDEWWPDILISDIGMPGEDGYMLIKKLRARESESVGHIPSNAPTAYGGSVIQRLSPAHFAGCGRCGRIPSIFA